MGSAKSCNLVVKSRQVVAGFDLTLWNFRGFRYNQPEISQLENSEAIKPGAILFSPLQPGQRSGPSGLLRGAEVCFKDVRSPPNNALVWTFPPRILTA